MVPGRSGRREIRELFITAACISVFLVYLLIERVHLKKRLSRIPLRICVTGTRGKSSVVRLIAACLRESRMNVLAKTTGSKACLLFPDGSEREIRRKGNPTILEGKKVLKVAARSGVHALVSEMMSIRPESLLVESLRMMKPHILVITNIRVDHIEEIGQTKDEAACAFASAIPGGSTVILPEEDEKYYPVLRQKAQKAGARLVLVPSRPSVGEGKPLEEIPAWEFGTNIRIALAVADFLEMDRDRSCRALRYASPDLGGLKVWRAGKESFLSGWYFVSAFAANDPESTRDVLAGLENRGLFHGKKRIGLLSLRKDRPGRSLQWLAALQGERDFAFDRLVFVGEHASILRNRLKKRIKTEITAFGKRNPEDLIRQLARLEKEESVVFGMGNMTGMGRSLVEYWELTGDRHDL